MSSSRNYWTLPGNLHQAQPLRYTLDSENELLALLQPETDLEAALFEDESFRQGMLWGEPRYGHPEGKIGLHVREVLDNIDRLKVNSDARARLRLVAFVHDTFKYKEHKGEPRDWSQHHAVLARRFLEQFTADHLLLELVELHDDAYYAWRSIHLFKDPEEGWKRLQRVFDRMGDELELYFLFFQCDTQTGDKNQMPLFWLEEIIRKRK